MAASSNIDRDWLKRRYVDDIASVEEMAAEVGCCVPNIRKWLKVWGIRRGKVFITAGKKPSWNKGLTKHTDERLRRLSEAHTGEGNPMYGVEAWNAGLTKDMDERVNTVAMKLEGRDVGADAREKMREAKLGKLGKHANHWKGGVYLGGAFGYTSIREKGRRKYQHRHVAETLLGRVLTTDEHVHHMDLDRVNNAPENLLVLSSAAHTALHSAMAKCPDLDQVSWLRENNIKFEEVGKYACKIS